MSEVDKAVQRALALGRLEERGVAWAQRAWALLRQWAEEDGHAVTMARHGGCRYLVIEVMAQQPAFSPGQRQGLMVTARLSTDVQVPAQATPSGLVIAGGGWLAVQALALAARL